MSRIQVEFVDAFVSGVKETFSAMVEVSVRRKDAWIKEGYTMYGEVSGVIGLSGPTTGTCAVSLPAEFARYAIGKMLCLPPDTAPANEEVRDGVGELINMIAGRAKTILSGSKYKFDINLPTIISGARHEVYQRKGTECLVILLETEAGACFTLEICVPV